jgi:6-pyruvoyl-tetrahydropterin synthase
LKFGYYEPITNKETLKVVEEIINSFDDNVIKEMEDLLLNPSREAIASLIWLPDRLKRQK